MRLKAEFAETATANFVLDMIAAQLAQEKAELTARVDDLVAANTRLQDDVNKLRAELEHLTRPQRAERADRRVAG